MTTLDNAYKVTHITLLDFKNVLCFHKKKDLCEKFIYFAVVNVMLINVTIDVII